MESASCPTVIEKIMPRTHSKRDRKLHRARALFRSSGTRRPFLASPSWLELGAFRHRFDAEVLKAWPLVVAAALLLLNVVDGASTLLWVGAGIAEEANALWGNLVVDSPFAFMAIKVGLVSAAVAFLVAQRHHLLARIGLVVSVVAYGMVFVWHLIIAMLVW